MDSISQKPEPNMSQMLGMVKPLPQDAEYPKEFFVEDLEYLPRTIYHIVRRTLWPVKGHSPAAKLEGTMKTLVFYILNGISFNDQDFFNRQFFASRIDLFGLKFYAPWVMRLIKLHSSVNYQPRRATILSSCLRLICPPKPSTLSLPKSHFIFIMLIAKASRSQLKALVSAMLKLLLILWLAIYVCLIVQTLKPVTVQLHKGLGSVLVHSMTESFL